MVSLFGIAAIVLWGMAIKTDAGELGVDVWLNSLHTPFLDAAGSFAAVVVGPTLAVVWGVVFAVLVSWRFRSVAIGLGAGLAVALSWVSSAVVKLVVARPRPHWDSIAHHVGTMEVDSSFPSGHVTFVASLTVVSVLLLWRTRLRWWVVAAGTAVTVFVALARVYIGVHYPSDVIAAMLYGIFGGVLAHALVGWSMTRFTLQERIDGGLGRVRGGK